MTTVTRKAPAAHLRYGIGGEMCLGFYIFLCFSLCTRRGDTYTGAASANDNLYYPLALPTRWRRPVSGGRARAHAGEIRTYTTADRRSGTSAARGRRVRRPPARERRRRGRRRRRARSPLPTRDANLRPGGAEVTSSIEQSVGHGVPVSGICVRAFVRARARDRSTPTRRLLALAARPTLLAETPPRPHGRRPLRIRTVPRRTTLFVFRPRGRPTRDAR